MSDITRGFDRLYYRKFFVLMNFDATICVYATWKLFYMKLPHYFIKTNFLREKDAYQNNAI